MLGYVFAYGSLVAEAPGPAVQETGSRPAPVWGVLRGWRRRWNVAMENLAPESDDKFFAEPGTGRRPEVFGVWLNLERCPGADCNGVALPVDGRMLRLLDQRERNYDRVEVTGEFVPAPGPPVWTYAGSPAARERFARGRAEGRAFVSRAYLEAVEAAFAGAGPQALADYRRSTLAPECPVRDDLRLVRRAPPGGGPDRA